MAIGILASLLSHFIIELLYHDYNFSHVINIVIVERIELFLLGSAVLFLLYTLLSSIFGSATIGSGVLLLISTVLGIATRYKMVFRSEPLYPNELYMVTELPFLLEIVGIGRSALIILAVLIAIGLFFLLYKYFVKPRKSDGNSKKIWLVRFAGIIASTVLLFYIYRFNYPNNTVKEIYDDYASWVTFSQSRNYSNNGFIAGFLFNLDALPMDVPENYSENAMNNLFEKYKEKSTEINSSDLTTDPNTNVIFVMNESFSDPFNLEGIESNKDPLPHYREIIQESINGEVLAPSLGGGTATNEFQALTGFSMETFDSINSPFTQLTSQIVDYPSIADRFKDFGYRATAIHPYSSSFYRRPDVYEGMNFDKFLHQDNMEYTERISEQHSYISDFSAYREVFEVMENTEEQDFIHVVTMQNHSGYGNKYDYVDYEVEGSGTPSEANAYFEDLENSDIALRRFINEIDRSNEPILLVFWGDHLPGFYQGEALENNNLALYETPLFVYSNEIDLNRNDGLISPFYLGNYVLEVLNIEITPYETLLREMQEYLPVVDNRMYIDNVENQSVSSRSELTKESQEILNDYTLLMYDITTGNQYAQELGFLKHSNKLYSEITRFAVLRSKWRAKHV